MEQETTFYEDLQKCKDLDFCDNRVKRHNLALVLIGLILAILRNQNRILANVHCII